MLVEGGMAGLGFDGPPSGTSSGPLSDATETPESYREITQVSSSCACVGSSAYFHHDIYPLHPFNTPLGNADAGHSSADAIPNM